MVVLMVALLVFEMEYCCSVSYLVDWRDSMKVDERDSMKVSRLVASKGVSMDVKTVVLMAAY